MKRLTELLNRHLVPPLTVLSENPYLSAIRAGMVSIVPLTIIGGLFMVACFFPVAWSSGRLAPDEIKTPRTLAVQLAQPTNEISKFLSAKISPASRTALERQMASSDVDTAWVNSVVTDFNQLISGRSFYEPGRFTNVPLREVTQQLMDRASGGMDLARLNRLL
ncbi:MAG: hypothetical protein FJ405_04785, partial [Verrucomicrobia bacterium]|nr:hypothetical protein [Verrucomicrobiota bacterium]